MKTLLNITLVLLALNVNSQSGWLGLDDKTIPTDKQLHIVGGMASGAIGYTLGYEWSKGNRNTATWVGIGSSAVLGTLKEVWDINSTGFDRDDLFSTIIGGVISTLATDLIMSRYSYTERKKIRLERIKRRDEARELHEIEKMERRLKRRNAN